MIELCVLVLLAVGALWFAFALIGLVFKAVFAVVGGLFGLVAGMLGLLVGGVVMLAVAPIVLLALLPFCLPLLLLVGLVWAIAHAARRTPSAPQPTH
jgi:hypothetical protein